MPNREIAALLLMIAIMLSNCSVYPEKQRQTTARQALTRRGLTYNAETFIDRTKSGDTEAVKLLLTAGMSPDVKDKDGYTPLMRATLGEHDDVTQILLDAGADVNARANDGYTPLMTAALKGHTNIVKAMIAKGADVEAKDKYDFTAIMYADAKGHADVIEVLLDAGAKSCRCPSAQLRLGALGLKSRYPEERIWTILLTLSSMREIYRQNISRLG